MIWSLLCSSGMDESTADVVEIHGTDPTTIEIIIRYVYSAKIELDTKNVQNLVQASGKAVVASRITMNGPIASVLWSLVVSSELQLAHHLHHIFSSAQLANMMSSSRVASWWWDFQNDQLKWDCEYIWYFPTHLKGTCVYDFKAHFLCWSQHGNTTQIQSLGIFWYFNKRRSKVLCV